MNNTEYYNLIREVSTNKHFNTHVFLPIRKALNQMLSIFYPEDADNYIVFLPQEYQILNGSKLFNIPIVVSSDVTFPYLARKLRPTN